MFSTTSAPNRTPHTRSDKGTESAKLTCSLITEVMDFHALRDQWNDLFLDCFYPTAFSTWDYATIWWRHFGSHAPISQKKLKLCIVAVTEADGRLVGIAPFYYEPNPGNLLQPRPLRLMGQPGRNNYMTEEPIVLLRRGFEPDAFDAILKYLLAHENSIRWDMLYIKAISDQAVPLLDSSILTSVLKGRIWDYSSITGPQLVHLPATWSEFRSQLSKSMRDNLPYYGRRLTRKGHAWSVRFVRDQVEIRDAADQLYRLHALRSASDRGVYHYNHMPSVNQLWFLQEMMSALARKEIAMIALLEVDGGSVIGAQAFFEYQDCVTVYYSGYDPEFYEFSPVFIIEEAVMRDAIARGLKIVNFLPDEAVWKARWGTTTSLRVEELICSSTTPIGLIRALGRNLYKKKVDSSLSPTQSS